MLFTAHEGRYYLGRYLPGTGTYELFMLHLLPQRVSHSLLDAADARKRRTIQTFILIALVNSGCK